MSDDPADRLWTVDDLAAYMMLSPNTVRSMASRQPERLPPKVGSFCRWEPSVVREWAVEQSLPVRKMGRPRLVR